MIQPKRGVIPGIAGRVSPNAKSISTPGPRMPINANPYRQMANAPSTQFGRSTMIRKR